MIHLQGSGKMTVQVKTPKEKQAVEVEEGATIRQVSMTCSCSNWSTAPPQSSSLTLRKFLPFWNNWRSSKISKFQSWHHRSYKSFIIVFGFVFGFPKICLFQFKEAISAKFSGAPVENLCLIFAGKIMKDQETLASHNVKVELFFGGTTNVQYADY